jgi:hypothetical protein
MLRKRFVLWLVLTTLLLFPLIFLNNLTLSSTPSSDNWVQTYEESAEKDRADSLIQCVDGGYLIAGTTNVSTTPPRTQLWLLKTDAHGNVAWNKTYGSIGSAIKGLVIQTNDGGYALAGTVSRRAEVIKTDSAGNLQWNRTFVDSSYAYCLIQTVDGGYVLLGSTGGLSASSGVTVWLVKITPSGDTVWNKTYLTLGDGGIKSIIQTKDKGFAAIGSTSTNPDFLLVKFDASGNLKWRKTFGSQDMDFGSSIVQDADGSYVMAGLLWNRSAFGGGNVPVGLVKADSSGNQLWFRNYPGRGGPLTMIRANDGNYILCSSMLDKIGGDGSLLWSKNVSFDENIADYYPDTSPLVVQTSDGGYAVAGTISSHPTDPMNTISYVWIGKLDSDGNKIGFVPELSWAAIVILLFVGCCVVVASKKRFLKPYDQSNNRRSVNK